MDSVVSTYKAMMEQIEKLFGSVVVPMKVELREMDDAVSMHAAGVARMGDEWEAMLITRAASTETHTKEWLSIQEQLIGAQLQRELAAGTMTAAQEAQARIEADDAATRARIVHQDAWLQHWMDTHLIASSYVQALGKTYDDVVDMMIRKQESWAKITQTLSMNLRRAFISNAAAMFKGWVTEQLKASVMSEAIVQKSAMTQKLIDAKAGARKAYSSMAAIPIVGQALGAAAAAAAFTFLMAFHKGGYIGAMLQPQRGNERIINTEVGEYVVNKRSVDTLGKDTLDFINRTGRIPDRAGSSGGVFAPHFHFDGVDGARTFVEDELIPFIQEAIQDGRLRGTLRSVTS
jgi:hypothetical protein